MKRNVSLVFFVLFIVVGAFAQKEDITSVEVNGVGYDDCVSNARIKALENAKQEALSKAGITEDINSYSDLFRSETSGSYQELFASSVFTNIRGSVKNVQILQEKLSITGEKLIKCEIQISCDVLKYKSLPDNMYKAEISAGALMPLESRSLAAVLLTQPDENTWKKVLVEDNILQKSFHCQI